MNKNTLKKISDNKIKVGLGSFVLIALIVIVLGAFALKESLVLVSVLVILETAIAVCLHQVELWIHGVFLLCEIIVGILTANPVLILLIALVYVAATFCLRVVNLAGDR